MTNHPVSFHERIPGNKTCRSQRLQVHFHRLSCLLRPEWDASKFPQLMNGRIIAIGDIHGCHQEFIELLQLIKLTDEDRLILLGDLVNRGPDSRKVVQLARERKAISLLGNHERRLLAAKHNPEQIKVRDSERGTFESLQSEDWQYLESMSLTHEIEELNTVFVHGGFLPSQPWQEQTADIVTEIQVIDREGKPRKRREDRLG